MRVDAFDFDLPPEAIALHPARPRDAARLLVVRPGQPLEDRSVGALPALLRRGDSLVVNDTRVIPGRLDGVRRRGEAAARIEATLHKREGADEWRAFVRPAKKLVVGETVSFTAGAAPPLDAVVTHKGDAGEVVLRFAVAGADLDAAIAQVGVMPLPPYIAAKRPTGPADGSDYQTMFAREAGAVAAPTAGLHFTPALLDALAAAGIGVERVTLHVGAGTFLPVKADDTANHRMHAEWGTLDADTAARLNATRATGGRVVAVGTTALRLLESAADEFGTIHPFTGDTAIFITPGYRFKAIDLLMTNFHLPRSTLFMLVAAFAGLDTMQAAYAHAIRIGLPVLFLRRRQPVMAHAPAGANGRDPMSAAFRFDLLGLSDGSGPDRARSHTARAAPFAHRPSCRSARRGP